MKSWAEMFPFDKREKKNIGQSERSAYKAAERIGTPTYMTVFLVVRILLPYYYFKVSPKKLPEPFLLQCSIFVLSFSSDLED